MLVDAYNASTILKINAYTHLLCSKLCQHNLPTPIQRRLACTMVNEVYEGYVWAQIKESIERSIESVGQQTISKARV